MDGDYLRPSSRLIMDKMKNDSAAHHEVLLSVPHFIESVGQGKGIINALMPETQLLFLSVHLPRETHGPRCLLLCLQGRPQSGRDGESDHPRASGDSITRSDSGSAAAEGGAGIPPLKAHHLCRLGPFVTGLIRQRADGLVDLVTSRRHRKKLGAVAVHPDYLEERARAVTRGEWTRLFAPQRLSWWVAVLFVIGSGLFSLAGFVSIDSPLSGWLNHVFFAGSLFFTSAAYLQWLEAVNGDVEQAGAGWRWFAWRPRNLGYLAGAIQLAGTVLFNFNTADAMIASLDWVEADIWVWTPNILGCICFLTASYLAYAEVSNAWASIQPRHLSWWIVIINLLGSVAFLLSAFYAFAGPGPENPDAARMASICTFSGALCFLVGSFLLLPEMFDEQGGAS